MIQTPRCSIYVADEFSKGQIEPSLKEAESTGSERGRLKVLVVDDHALIADTLAEILRAAGFDTVTAYSGWAALEMAARFHPDYLLSDVLMPRMNGVELAIAIRKMYPAAKVLLFSGQAGISDILLNGQKQGFEFELVAKPIHPLKLIERLKQQ
jgi:CheY-like chemotaxis protein